MTGLPDLPDELLHYILSLFVPPSTIEFQSFWSRGITAQTLLPPDVDDKKYQELSQDQIQTAKKLCRVSKRLRSVFVPIIWSRFQCGTVTGLRNLRHSCAGSGELGSYIRHLNLQLCFSISPLPLNLVSNQLEAIWPRLTSLHSLTLVLTSASPCPAWLVAQLRSLPTLRTLRLCVFGNSLGPDLRALSQLQNLYLEIHPPDSDGKLSEWVAPDEPIEVQRAAYHDWTELFNDVWDFIESNASGGNLKTMTWFIYWTMVHSFYKHMKQHTSDPSNTKHIDQPCIRNLSQLSLTLESQMGTRSFLDAVQEVPLTDLAFTAYDLSLLNGTIFRVFCNAFPELRRLRIKLRPPSHTVGDGAGAIPEGSVNEEDFVSGLASLQHLEAYKGPVLFQRHESVEARRSLRSQVNESLARLLQRLRATGRVNPEVLLQWHVWSGGVYGPKEYMLLPAEGPRVLGVGVEQH